MSCWHDGVSYTRGPLYWLEASLSLAYKYGLHIEDTLSGVSPSRRSLHKSIWWSLYAHSQLLNLSTTHPLRIIARDNFNVRYLTMEDFELHPFSSNIRKIMHDCTILGDVEEQRTVAKIFLGKVSSCIEIGSTRQGYSASNGVFVASQSNEAKNTAMPQWDKCIQQCNQPAELELSRLSGLYLSSPVTDT